MPLITEAFYLVIHKQFSNSEEKLFYIFKIMHNRRIGQRQVMKTGYPRSEVAHGGGQGQDGE